jgi:hypothetical protein
MENGCLRAGMFFHFRELPSNYMYSNPLAFENLAGIVFFLETGKWSW